MKALLGNRMSSHQAYIQPLDMRGHGDYLLRPIDIAMTPNESNDTINSFFTLPHTCSAFHFLDIYFSSLPYQKRNKKSKLLIFKMFYNRRQTGSSMNSAILNGIVGVHIHKRVSIGTRSANQNPYFYNVLQPPAKLYHRCTAPF